MKLILALRLCLPWFTPAADAPPRPNILWLIAEDFGPHLGCYGTKEVSTPNLDALAAGGMRFTRCFTTAPVCSPSRSAFMTGMYATTIGAHNHRSNRDGAHPLPDGVRLLKDHQPFFAQVNFQETHRDYHAPKHADPAGALFYDKSPAHAGAPRK